MHFIFVTCILLLIPFKGYSWGSRAHSATCEASTFLIKNPALRKTLVPLGYMLGHICIIPDDDWKEHHMKERGLGILHTM